MPQSCPPREPAVKREKARRVATPGHPSASATAKRPNAALTVTRACDAAGELAVWGAAVAHLHACGLPAAVPVFPAAWLARRGVRPDWRYYTGGDPFQPVTGEDLETRRCCGRTLHERAAVRVPPGG